MNKILKQNHNPLNFNPTKNIVINILILTIGLSNYGILGNGYAKHPENNSFYQQQDDDKNILAKIRLLRSLIEEEEWVKAESTAIKILADYPKNRYLDMVYYWLVYSQYKQGKTADAVTNISKLQQEFPDSAWIEEANLLQIELTTDENKRLKLIEESILNGDDEKKSRAIENLLKIDEDKAYESINEILRPDSGESLGLKDSILLILAQEGSKRATDKIVEIAQIEKNEELLKRAVINLDEVDETVSFPVLKNILNETTNTEIIEAALYSITEHQNLSAMKLLSEFARFGKTKFIKSKSIIWLGQIDLENSTKELMNLYHFYNDTELKEQVLITLNERDSTDSIKAIIDLIENETDKSLIKSGIELLKQKSAPFVREFLKGKNINEQ